MEKLLTFGDLQLIAKNWSKPLGLVYSSLILTVLIFAAFTGLNTGFSLNLGFIQFIEVLLIILVMNILLWLLFYGVKKLFFSKPNKINIMFSFSVDAKTSDLYHKLYEYFKRKIESIDERNNFYVSDISEQYQFTNRIKAESFILQEKITLLIWGNIEAGNINGQEAAVFNPTFSYNYKLKSNNPEEYSAKKQLFSANIQQSINNRNWQIFQNQSLPQLKVVTANFVEVSLYIVARCIITLGYMKLANEYCLEIVESLKSKDKSTYPDYDTFKKLVLDTHLQLCDFLMTFFSLEKIDLNEAEKYANEILKYYPNSFGALTHLARLSWLKGAKDDAKRFAHRAKEANPSSNINRFNEAFFALEEEDFTKVLNMYKKIKNIPEEMGNILQVTTFLESEYDNTANLSMLFASGYLNFYYADKERGIELLNSFDNEVEKKGLNQKYKILLDSTKTTLNQK